MRRVLVIGLLLSACAGEDPLVADDAGIDAGVVADAGSRDTSGLPYARGVVQFDPGPEAGFGQDGMPSVVLGPPASRGASSGSLDVVSLGIGGTLVVEFGERAIVDGPGADFVVFENAFWVGGDSTEVFAELGEVAVSTDAVSWHTFPCDFEPLIGPWPGCAGWRPTYFYDPFVLPLDPEVSGGDPFDLADVGLSEARYVRIRDLARDGAAPSAGFDLDAVGIVHAR